MRYLMKGSGIAAAIAFAAFAPGAVTQENTINRHLSGGRRQRRARTARRSRGP